MSNNTWSHTFDFTINDGGWTPYPTPPLDDAIYIPGVGWTPAPSYNDLISLTISFPQSMVTEVDLHWSMSASATVFSAHVTTVYSPTGHMYEYIHTYGTRIGSPQIDDFAIYNDLATEIRVWLNAYSGAGIILTSIEIQGIGTNPFLGLTHKGPADCPFCHAAVGNEQSKKSISLLDGEKRELVTDLSVNTPAGALAFTRAYRQSTLTDPALKMMGLGWTHNHNFLLTKYSGPPNTIIIRMPRGGELHLTETSSGSNSYVGDPGSTAVIEWDGTKYTLTTQDAKQYIFDPDDQLSPTQWQLTSLVYPTGEAWDYAYDDDNDNRLISITDTYGKGLQFAYIDNPSGYDNGQLWRVGDQAAIGLEGEDPHGRYVEFGYIEEKLDGSTTGTPNPLLATVRDVREYTWTYHYYGQNAGEDDSDQKNFLSEFLSPTVDTTGSGSLGPELSLDRLIYTVDGTTVTNINQQRGEGLIETDWEFQPNGESLTNEVTAGKTTIHYFESDLLLGTEDPAGNIAPQLYDNQFRPAAQIDANGNQTSLTWSGDGRFLNSVKDALRQETFFAYDDAERLKASVDAEGRKTRYIYDGTLRQPTLVLAETSANLAVNGDMELDSNWSSVGTPTNNERSTEQVDQGSYSRYIKTDAASEGIEGEA